MAAPARKSSSIITHRAKNTIALPPMILGYSNLLDPETFDPDKPKLTMNGHLTPAAITAMQQTIEQKVYSPAALEAIRKECSQNGVKGADTVKSAEAWLEAALKEPKEGFPIQLPFLKLGNSLHYFKTVDGERVQQTRQMQAWTPDNRKLNLKKLRLGRGSVVEAIVYPNLFFSKVIGAVQPSFKLVGIRILELKQFEGSSAPAETDDQAIQDVLGRELEHTDLSAYLSGAEDEDDDHEEQAQGKPPVEEQSPADRAKGMF